MKAFEFINNLRKQANHKHASKAQVVSQLRLVPKKHAIWAGSLTIALTIVASLPSEKAVASRNTKAIDVPKLADAPPSQTQQQIVSTPTSPEALVVESNKALSKQKVRSGDNLSKIFDRAGLSDNDMFALVNSSKQAKRLANLMPGQEFLFEVNKEGKLSTLVRYINKLNSETFTKTEAGYSYQKNEKTPDVQMAMRSGTIKSSLYNAGMQAGLDDALIMELAGVFGWDIDFALDLRTGDTFQILYEEKFLEGERLGAGRILAAEFVNQKSTFKAVLYTDKNGDSQYYSPTGKAMRKAFLRAPLDFRRISSNFNPRRLHPITKTVRPHRGTDYAASRGTPVWAAGDGKVLSSAYSKSNGNYVVIQHGGDVRTKYLHLHKRKVRKGDRVKQKQIIGTVGTTGLSTAPHLHYEFLLSGVHRNPRTIVSKLPKARSVPKNELQRFFSQTQPIMAQLEKTTQMAAIKPSSAKL